MKNHMRAYTADIRNFALSFTANKKYEHNIQNITKVNIPTLD